MLSIAAEGPSDELDLVFGALADPTRRQILERLVTGDANVTDLAAPFSISLPAISRHLRVLEHASLITRSREGRCRSARLAPTPLADAAIWLAQCERAWVERLDRLDDHLARLDADWASRRTESRNRDPHKEK